MRLLLLRGNPRAHGYSRHFTDLFARGAASAGADIRDVALSSKTIAPCLGCYHCWLAAPGECVHRDDMQALLREFIDADVVVCSSPLYFYSLSSLMHRFLERTFPLTKPGLDATPDGLFRNRTRYPETWGGKMLIFILTGALRDVRNFRPCQETCRLIAGGLAMTLGGVLIRPESHLTSFAAAKPLTIKRVESAFIEAGRHAALAGNIPQSVLDAASGYIEAGAATFKQYSEIYWDTACAMGEDAMDMPRLVSRVSRDVRLIIQRMVSAVDPVATASIKAMVQFNFTNPPSAACIVIDRGTARVTWEDSSKPDLRISCESHTWAAIAQGELNPAQALKQGLLTLDGERSLYLRLPRFFPVVG